MGYPMSRIGCLCAPFYHEWVCRNSEKAEAAKYINQEIRGMICIRLLFGSCIYRLYHTHALGTSVWEVKLEIMTDIPTAHRLTNHSTDGHEGS